MTTKQKKLFARVMLVATMLAALNLACRAPARSTPTAAPTTTSAPKITSLTTTLDGSSKPHGPPTAKDSDGYGTAIIRLDSAKGEVCWELSASDIAPANAAHIHYKEGPQAITLSPPTNGSSSGCANASTDLVQTILQNPEDFYVVVHNAEFPTAALDGRLALSK